jgi:hypothetical protein
VDDTPVLATYTNQCSSLDTHGYKISRAAYGRREQRTPAPVRVRALLGLPWDHEGAPNDVVVIVGDPLQVAFGAGDVRLGGPAHRDREALLLLQLREPEHPRLHDDGHVLGHLYDGGVHGVGLPDVGHGPVHGDGLGQQVDDEGRVVELCFGDGLDDAAGDGAVRDLGDAVVSEPQPAEVGDVVVGVDVVDEARVEREGRVDVSRAHGVECGVVVLLVLDGHAGSVDGVGGGHDGGLDGGGGPVRVQALEQRGDAAEVRRGHGRPGLDEEGEVGAVGELSVRLAGRPRREDVHPGPGDVRLQDARAGLARPAGREEGDSRRRVRPDDRPLEENAGRRVGGGVDVRGDLGADVMADVRRREDMRVGEGGVPVRRLVHHDHARPAVRRHGLPHLDAVVEAPALAEHHLSRHLGVAQHAAVAAGIVAVGAGVHERKHARGGVVPRLEQRLAVELPAVAEPHGGADRAVHGPRGHGEHPGRAVADGAGVGPSVARGAADDDAALRGPERRDGDGVVVELSGGVGADGEGQHVDTVLDGGVQSGDDVHDGAPATRAHLVDGQVRVRRSPGGRPVRVAPHVGVLHEVARGGAGCVRAVARVVHGGRRGVHGGAPERPRADHLVVAPAAGQGLELARAVPPLGRRLDPVVLEGRVARQDPRVQDPDHHAAAEPRPAPETLVPEVEAQEPRRPGRRQRQEHLRVQPRAAVRRAQRVRLRVREASREAGEDLAVRVDDPRAVVVGRVRHGHLRQERAVPLLDVSPAAAVPRLEVHDVVLPLLQVRQAAERVLQGQEEEQQQHGGETPP